MAFALAHQEEARIVRHLPPFVEIKRDGIRALDTGKARRKLGREDRERAKGAVDVKPQLLFAA